MTLEQREYFLNHILLGKLGRIAGLGVIIETQGFDRDYFAHLMAEVRQMDTAVREVGQHFYQEKLAKMDPSNLADISEFLTFRQVIRNQTASKLGIINFPDNEQLQCIQATAQAIHTPLCEHFGRYVPVSNFFMSPLLLHAIAGEQSDSQHATGQAMDLDATGMDGLSNWAVFNFIKDHLPFDQLIWEHGTQDQPDWIHVSHKASGNRNEVIYHR